MSDEIKRCERCKRDMELQWVCEQCGNRCCDDIPVKEIAPESHGKDEVVKPVRAWAVLDRKGNIDVSTCDLDKQLVVQRYSELPTGFSFIEVEIRPVALTASPDNKKLEKEASVGSESNDAIIKRLEHDNEFYRFSLRNIKNCGDGWSRSIAEQTLEGVPDNWEGCKSPIGDKSFWTIAQECQREQRERSSLWQEQVEKLQAQVAELQDEDIRSKKGLEGLIEQLDGYKEMLSQRSWEKQAAQMEVERLRSALERIGKAEFIGNYEDLMSTGFNCNKLARNTLQTNPSSTTAEKSEVPNKLDQRAAPYGVSAISGSDVPDASEKMRINSVNPPVPVPCEAVKEPDHNLDVTKKVSPVEKCRENIKENELREAVKEPSDLECLKWMEQQKGEFIEIWDDHVLITTPKGAIQEPTIIDSIRSAMLAADYKKGEII